MSKQRVHTFKSTLVEDLDEQINEFIKSKKGAKVVSISHSTCSFINTDGDRNTEAINYSVSVLLQYDK